MIKNFFKVRVGELHNITWPTRNQATHAMITVLAIMILIGVLLSVLDYFLNQVVLHFLA